MSSHITIFTKNEAGSYLESAIDVSKWIEKFEVNKEEGISWQLSSKEGSSDGDKLAAQLTDRSIYSGAAGIGCYLVQLYEITGKEEYLEKAVKAGEHLIATFSEKLGDKPGIHTGLAGEGYFTEVLYKKTGDKKFHDYALTAGKTIYERADKEEKGLHWYGIFDYMGDGGAITYWIYLYEITKDRSYLEYAKQGIDYILTLKKYEDDKEIYWKFFDMHDYFASIPEGGIVPNFAHGTSGIVYILTRYYEVSHDEKYLEYAKKGFNFLKRIAINDGDASIIPYVYFSDPNVEFDVFYLSLCHGPVGTGVVVKELYKATGDIEYKEYFERLSNALVKADVAFKKSKGYWNDCVCCGAAGALMHFVSGYKLTGEESYRQYAQKIADKLIADAFKDTKGTRWYNAWTRVIPWNVDAYNGLYIGAAGCASALLSLYAELENKEITPIYEF